MRVYRYGGHILRETVRANPKDVYLFGDNMLRRGWGGMAIEMRGEPNCVGIPTKIAPRMDEDAFFTDADFVLASSAIDASLAGAVELAKSLGGDIVIPESLGKGFSQLPQRAPKIWQHLQTKLSELENLSYLSSRVEKYQEMLKHQRRTT